MAIEPEYETIICKKEKETLKERFQADCKTDVETSEIEKVIFSSSRLLDVFCEKKDDKIIYGGKIVFCCFYTDVNGNVKKKECVNEFSNVIEHALGEEDDVSFDLSVEKTESDVSGVKLCFSSFVKGVFTVTEDKSVNFLTSGNGLVAKTEEREVIRFLGEKKGTFPIEEEFEINYPVADVLCHKLNAVAETSQCGIGTVIIDGELSLSALLLQNQEKRNIIRENKTLPFRIEVEFEDAMPSMSARSEVWVKSFKTDVAVDEENNKSEITLSVVLNYKCEVFSEEKISVVTDAFSVEEETECVFDKYETENHKGRIKKEKAVKIRCANQDLPSDITVLAVEGEKAEIVSSEKTEKGIATEGVFFAYLITENSEGKITAVKTEGVFKNETETEGDCELTALIIKEPSARIISSAETEISFIAEEILTQKEKDAFGYISSVTAKGEKKKNDFPISVYIATENEDLWSLSKRLNVCPEQVLACNKDLQFPLSGEERIVVYRQLTK